MWRPPSATYLSTRCTTDTPQPTCRAIFSFSDTGGRERADLLLGAVGNAGTTYGVPGAGPMGLGTRKPTADAFTGSNPVPATLTRDGPATASTTRSKRAVTFA